MGWELQEWSAILCWRCTSDDQIHGQICGKESSSAKLRPAGTANLAAVNFMHKPNR